MILQLVCHNNYEIKIELTSGKLEIKECMQLTIPLDRLIIHICSWGIQPLHIHLTLNCRWYWFFINYCRFPVESMVLDVTESNGRVLSQINANDLLDSGSDSIGWVMAVISCLEGCNFKGWNKECTIKLYTSAQNHNYYNYYKFGFSIRNLLG